MKIFVKTLKGDRFEIQVNPDDSIADVKKNIETVLGVTAYPATEQVLVHKGKVLTDETTVEANNVSEKGIIGVMKRKRASTETSTLTETPTDIPVTHTEPDSAGASYVSSERVSESSIQKILGMEYLYFGTQDQTQEPGAPAEADQEEYLRAKVQSDPSVVKDFVERLEEHNPSLFQSIQDNKSVFLLLLEVEGEACGNEMEQPHELEAVQTNEPNNGGGDGGNQVGESKETEVEVATPEDNELIEQLEAMGFERGDAEEAYFACNKNVQEAANHLLGYKHESQE